MHQDALQEICQDAQEGSMIESFHVSDIAMGKPFGIEIAKVLGLDINRVSDIHIISTAANDAVKVNVTCYMTYEEFRVATARMRD